MKDDMGNKSQDRAPWFRRKRGTVEVKQRTVTKGMCAGILALALALPTTLSGCVAEDQEISSSRNLGVTEVAEYLQEKYEQEKTVDYAEGESLVARDHEFIVSYDFDPVEAGMDNYTEIASLYYDAELTQSVPSEYDWASEDKKSYSISPWEYPGRAAQTAGAEDYPYGVKDGSTRLFDRGPFADWGNMGTMYLATWVDLQTGAPLDKPIVQVVTVKGELDTPKLSLDMTEDGLVQFSWKEIKGAKAYYVVEFATNEEREIQSARLIGQTSNTTWSSEMLTDSVTGDAFNTNKDFTTYLVSEDDWYSPQMVEAYAGEYDPADGAVTVEIRERKLFCVVAVNEAGSSMYSNMLDIQNIASVAPSSLAYSIEKQSEEGFSGYVKGVNRMPSHRWIILCNGEISQRLVNYDFKAVTKETETWYNEKEDGSGYEAEQVDVIKVPYFVDGTAFSGTLIISEYDKALWEDQLAQVEARQESLRNKTGDVKREITVEDEEEAPAKEEVPSKEKPETEIAVEKDIVTANSALSEYLALSMISGLQEVDLAAFPEALDQEYLVDAWAEAFYQNPLILGVEEVMTSRDGKTLYLVYEDDQQTRERKQAEITKEVDRVVSDLVDGTMTAREKEFAINQYLCDTVTYDYDALDNAAQYDFMTVDSAYYDSFTAYGALLKGVGVCASYSASFKLLAEAADLDCVVVTGFLDGTLGHAWNRVALDEEGWVTVDSTNNDMDILPNALLNAPDSAIATTLVEDDLWLMDSALGDYSNESEEYEFYHVEGLFFERDAVVDQLVDQLSSSDIAVVRTDYSLTDDQFYEIGGEVALASNNPELGGFYWMGVIVMTSDYSLLE